MKVLVVAEAANPDWTSVPLIGWLVSREIKKQFDGHLVTQIRNLKAIEAQGWVLGEDFTVIDTEAITKPLNTISNFVRGNSGVGWTLQTALQSLSYPYFERLIWRKFRNQFKNKQFDVVHRVTPVSPTASSFLAKKLHKLGIPFVVGPLNGGVPWPQELESYRAKERDYLSRLRFVSKLSIGYVNTRKYCSAIIAGSKYTFGEQPKRYLNKTFLIPENGIDRERFQNKSSNEFKAPLRAVFIGRLVPYKGLLIAIKAINEFAKEEVITYDIYGSGPEYKAAGLLIKKLDIEKSVKLHGFVKNTELQDKLIDADIFLFPSIREFGGGVVLEAMSVGVVPIVLDYAGPSEIVDHDTGFKIPIGSEAEIVESIKTIISKIIQDPNVLISKKAKAMEKIDRLYTWEVKVKQFEKIYKWACSQENVDKPSLGFE